MKTWDKLIIKKKIKKRKDKLTRLELTTPRISKPALYPLSYRDTYSTWDSFTNLKEKHALKHSCKYSLEPPQSVRWF